MRDKLLLNFGAKFQRHFIISHVKLQNWHGNVSCQDDAPDDAPDVMDVFTSS